MMTYARKIMRKRRREEAIAKQVALSLRNRCRLTKPLDDQAIKAIGLGIAGYGGPFK